MEAAPYSDGTFKTKHKETEIFTDLEDQVIDPETEAAIYECLVVYAKGEQNPKNFSKFLKCLSEYVDFDTLKKYIYS